ncbi:MAG: phosphate ABC transporter permease PstA [Rhodospirillales bacterium]|mgnify:FL=1|nr:phosphate ABC transporter permease PstA [Rhodospirillales bacterium]
MPKSIDRGPNLSAERFVKRYRSEKYFKYLGLFAIGIALSMLIVLTSSIIFKGHSAFWQTHIAIDVQITSEDVASISNANFRGITRTSIRSEFPEVKSRRDKKQLYKLFSNGISFEIKEYFFKNKIQSGGIYRVWVKASADIDMLRKGFINRDLEETNRRISDKQLKWYDQLDQEGRIEKKFNVTFFTAADSREPEQAGILGALVGSILTLFITLILSFPIGVGAAIYLEEFAKKNYWSDLIEVNINNLAAVPSIVFGLLGLAVLLNWFGMPRSAPIAGGAVLALMTLPTIIISSRSALKAVPPSIREAALGMGASRLQTMLHHVVPLAMPGMLTGAIIGMAQALGETAPLLMMGMVAFIVDVPGNLTDAATVLPVQIFLWADAPERAFVERTSAAIMVLLLFLVTMNLVAILLRKHFERRW